MAQNKSQTPTDEGWETVAEAAPTQVQFDDLGDKFIGVYKGFETITNPNDGKEWTQYLFTGIFLDELAGEHCGINGTFQLDKEMGKVPVGHETMITYVKDVPTNKGNPMKSFDIKARVPRVTAS